MANRLSLNVAKTEFMLIGSHYKLRSLQSQPYIAIDGKKLKQVYHSKGLGVEIDKYLIAVISTLGVLLKS